MREVAQRERRQARGRRIAENRQNARLQAGPVADQRRAALDDIAFNLHNAYDWRGRGDQCVTAVIRKPNNRHLVFAQRFMAAMEAYGRQHYAEHALRFKPGGGAHLHAEMYAVLHYLLREQDPREHISEIGVSKPICPMCAWVLDYLGIQYTDGWVTDELSSHWLNPWDMLPESCKPAVKKPRDDEDDPDDDSGRGGFGVGSFGGLGIDVR